MHEYLDEDTANKSNLQPLAYLFEITYYLNSGVRLSHSAPAPRALWCQFVHQVLAPLLQKTSRSALYFDLSMNQVSSHIQRRVLASALNTALICRMCTVVYTCAVSKLCSQQTCDITSISITHDDRSQPHATPSHPATGAALGGVAAVPGQLAILRRRCE